MKKADTSLFFCQQREHFERRGEARNSDKPIYPDGALNRPTARTGQRNENQGNQMAFFASLLLVLRLNQCTSFLAACRREWRQQTDTQPRVNEGKGRDTVHLSAV